MNKNKIKELFDEVLENYIREASAYITEYSSTNDEEQSLFQEVEKYVADCERRLNELLAEPAVPPTIMTVDENSGSDLVYRFYDPHYD